MKNTFEYSVKIQSPEEFWSALEEILQMYEQEFAYKVVQYTDSLRTWPEIEFVSWTDQAEIEITYPGDIYTLLEEDVDPLNILEFIEENWKEITPECVSYDADQDIEPPKIELHVLSIACERAENEVKYIIRLEAR